MPTPHGIPLRPRPASPRTIAVIGGGVAGIVAAHLLSQRHRVELFEKNTTLGGHTHTITIEAGPDAGLTVDTGFIVLNDRTYPLFRKFLEELGVPVAPSNMSFSCHDRSTGRIYAGTGLSGLFARRRDALRIAHWHLLGGIMRFNRRALADFEAGRLQRIRLGDYVAETGCHPAVIRDYLVPMMSAIWSASGGDVMDFPMESFVRFFHNHGLLTFRNRPQWLYIPGGSQRYIQEFRRRFPGIIHTATPIRSLRRRADGVTLRRDDGTEIAADAVVVATHADQALRLLEDPSPDERRRLGSWTYSHNRTILHTDLSFMPPLRRAWASWNYCRDSEYHPDTPASLTYHMNRLQRLNSPRHYLVTLNPSRDPAPGTVIADLEYTHPRLNLTALEAQAGLPSLNGCRHTWFCGSYFGYGFHEDAVRSAVEAVRTLEDR